MYLGVITVVLLWAFVAIKHTLANGITKKIMVLQFDPVFPSLGNQKLRQAKGWSNPVDLENSYISEVRRLSNNYVNFQIVERQEINDIPVKGDSFDYTESSYLACLNNSQSCHSPDIADYSKILRDYQVCEKVNSGQVDELWLWGGPWFGYWEAVMAGPNSFNTNAYPITGTSCQRQLNIMGFSYERGLSEMMEDLGHRFEGTMAHVFGEDPRWSDSKNTVWGRFASHDGCGWMHRAPNSTSEYDWSNSGSASSSCGGTIRQITCSDWGCTGLGFKTWWLSHISNSDGQTDGKWNNWWKYVFDYEGNAPSFVPTSVPPTATIRPTPTTTPRPTITSTPRPTPTVTPTPTASNNPFFGGPKEFSPQPEESIIPDSQIEKSLWTRLKEFFVSLFRGLAMVK